MIFTMTEIAQIGVNQRKYMCELSIYDLITIKVIGTEDPHSKKNVTR